MDEVMGLFFPLKQFLTPFSDNCSRQGTLRTLKPGMKLLGIETVTRDSKQRITLPWEDLVSARCHEQW